MILKVRVQALLYTPVEFVHTRHVCVLEGSHFSAALEVLILSEYDYGRKKQEVKTRGGDGRKHSDSLAHTVEWPLTTGATRVKTRLIQRNTSVTTETIHQSRLFRSKFQHEPREQTARPVNDASALRLSFLYTRWKSD